MGFLRQEAQERTENRGYIFKKKTHIVFITLAKRYRIEDYRVTFKQRSTSRVSAAPIVILLGWLYGLGTGVFKSLPGDSRCDQDATMAFESVEIHLENNRVHCEELLLSLITE